MCQADLGLIGLAVMGENLIWNAESRGFHCAVYNRTTDKMERFTLLNKIGQAYDTNPVIVNLLMDPYFREVIENAQLAWRRIITLSVNMGIPMPTMGAALIYMDSYRMEQLPASLLQAQRDYFGAHTYERIDRPRGEFFHTNWTGRGGTTSSSSCNP